MKEKINEKEKYGRGTYNPNVPLLQLYALEKWSILWKSHGKRRKTEVWVGKEDGESHKYDETGQ